MSALQSLVLHNHFHCSCLSAGINVNIIMWNALQSGFMVSPRTANFDREAGYNCSGYSLQQLSTYWFTDMAI